MSDRQRIIKVQGGFIYLDPDHKWDSQSMTNLPQGAFTFVDGPFYWMVEIMSYDRVTKSVLLNVVDYHPIGPESFTSQHLQAPIDQVIFSTLDWAYLEPFLSSYQKSRLLPFIKDSNDVIHHNLQKEQFRYEVTIRWSDLICRDGYVMFEQYLPILNRDAEIKMYNPHIRAELDFIKPLFVKVLKRKTLDVEIDVEMVGDKTSIEAKSKHLDLVNDQLIRMIKVNRITQAVGKPKAISIDKNLFTAEELLDSFGDEVKMTENAFDIIQILVDHQKIRNRQQLLYLAGKKHSEDKPIYLTLQPHFGFLFVVPGRQMMHFCWELLNSHATYVWSFDVHTRPTNDYMLSYIEQAIQMIFDQGRDSYKRYYVSKEEDAVSFQTIVHQYADSKVKDHFVVWRQRLESMLF